MTRHTDTDLSRILSHALRHAPGLYKLELDGEGWASLDAVLTSLRGQRREWANLSVADLKRVIDSSGKRRHEINGNKIRAFYGHSVSGLLSKEKAVPPVTLYHGTAPDIAVKIRSEGLKPMRRQYVHLSIDVETAYAVGLRKSKTPILLEINAAEASKDGILFYRGNEKVWLADKVPPKYIHENPSGNYEVKQ